VPLPLLFGAIPVVSCDLVAELAAGRGLSDDPALLCAKAGAAESAKAIKTGSVTVFMMLSFA
jgi:hypothetical protein